MTDQDSSQRAGFEITQHPFDSDKLREECGVFGIFGSDHAATMTALGLHALQHRGQEAAGIVTFEQDKKLFHLERRLGLVGDNFTKDSVLSKLPGTQAIGHVRYSTTGGSTILRNVQPLFAELIHGGFSIAHNGNLTNAQTLREDLIRKGAIFQSTSDTETFLHLVASSSQQRTLDKLVDALHQVEGAYALVVMTNKKLIGARDPLGIRPLVLGKIGDAYVLASETCALDIIDAEFVRDIEPGEVVVITESGLESFKPFVKQAKRFCIFEYVYFSRPDSVAEGKSVYNTRKRAGAILAREKGVEADYVVPVPDSSTPAAIGYAAESGIPFELGIIRNHYVGRSFIEPTDQIRNFKLKLKHNALPSEFQGKRVILIDDSIVRGNTSRKIVAMMREAGASEVHMRIASPPMRHSCFYGVDTPSEEELMASGNNAIAVMRDNIGCDSLEFISLDGLYQAMGEDKRDGAQPQYCDACLSNDYPVPLVDKNANKDGLLPILTEQD